MYAEVFLPIAGNHKAGEIGVFVWQTIARAVSGVLIAAPALAGVKLFKNYRKRTKEQAAA